jgi:hypothetical protein
MNRTGSPPVAALALGLVLGGLPFAQSNLIPGTDVALGKMDTISALGRTGTFPNGMNGVALSTTSCNKGTVKVPWEAAMEEDHPFIAFLVARESDGRLTQASDRSYVKHGFFALTDNFCDVCTEGPFGGGDVLGIGCSDTYSTSNNGDQYWLGPPDEINPWLGEWEHVCSHFDQGEPAVAAPLDCDGNRSLSTAMASALNPVGHRMNVSDQEFQTPGTWYYQGYYVIRGEPEGARENNWGTRLFTPTWSGSKWNLLSTTGFANGSILNRWSGAVVTSAKNGNDDGRIYVATKVTGPVGGFYHYEYALQNRDNFRGAGDVSIPLCPGARVKDVGFSDVDDDPSNDWIAAVRSGSIDLDVNDNPVRWNTFYNFWFDSDAAPVPGFVNVLEFDAGAGLAALDVATGTPTGLYNVYLGDGCTSGGPFPTLYANGQATLGNPGFALESAGNQAGQLHLVVASAIDGAVSLGSTCYQWFGGSLGAGAFLFATTVSDGSGIAHYGAPIPSDPSYEGLSINFQGAGLNPAGGPIGGLFELTNGLKVRLGNSLPGCP